MSTDLTQGRDVHVDGTGFLGLAPGQRQAGQVSASRHVIGFGLQSLKEGLPCRKILPFFQRCQSRLDKTPRFGQPLGFFGTFR